MSAPKNTGMVVETFDSFRVPGPPTTTSAEAAASSSTSKRPPPPPTALDPSHVPYRLAASHILSKLQSHSIAPPIVGIICGSGLSGLSDALDKDDDDDGRQISIPYTSIPGFPAVSTTVAGHAGELVVGTLHGIPAICFRGRFHSYEGHDMNVTALPARVMRCLGTRLVIVTNAAGGLNNGYEVGDVAVIRDHVALPLLAGKNPLVGPNDDELGPRFPPTSDLYDARLQDVVAEVARSLDFDRYLHLNGTYAFVSGPQYESRSECAMLRMLGADAVGMSTVPEILAAHHAGMAVLCLSLITNKVVYYDETTSAEGEGKKVTHANHAEVLEAVKGRGEQMVKLVGEVVKRCGEVYLPELEDLTPICLETEGRVAGEEEEEEEKKSSEKECSGFTMCPFSMVKTVWNAPTHWLIMGGVIFAAGAVSGLNIGRRT